MMKEKLTPELVEEVVNAFGASGMSKEIAILTLLLRVALEMQDSLENIELLLGRRQ